MARKPRVEFEGAFYHVIARGNQRRAIFRDDLDRLAYLERIERYRSLYGFRVYAYVLMTNHVHLLIETHRVALSKIMQAIQFAYTRYFNRRYRTVGHLFQGRYKAILCDREAYLLELLRYIHLNPARVRRPEDPWKYRWSSHGAYLGGKTTLQVETSLALSQLGPGVKQAQRAYMRFLAEGRGMGHEEKYYETVDQRFLGDDPFIDGLQKRILQREIEFKGPKVPLTPLIEAVAEEHNAKAAELVRGERERGRQKARAMLVYLAREWSRVQAKELAKRLHRDPSMISRLYGIYLRNRDEQAEARVRRRVTTK